MDSEGNEAACAIRVGDIRIPEEELRFSCCRASGPGGQHVNRTSSAVQLRFDAAASPSLPEDVRERLLKLPDSRLSSEGVLVIDAREHRSQLRNKECAIARLAALIARASAKPKPRRKTKPSKAVLARRMLVKKAHSQLKRGRMKPGPDCD